MTRFGGWQVALMIAGMIAVGVGLSLLFGLGSGSHGAPAGPSASIVLADPMDPPERTLPEPTVGSAALAQSVVPGKRTEAAELTTGDRQKATVAKDILKRRVASGSGTDADARMLRALCRQLHDESCSR